MKQDGDDKTIDMFAELPVEVASADSEPGMVQCACGDQFPADSWGAGFMAAAGCCFGCDAARDADEPECPDLGPWVVFSWRNGRVALQSLEGVEDAALEVSGNFAGVSHRTAYANKLCDWLNAQVKRRPG